MGRSQERIEHQQGRGMKFSMYQKALCGMVFIVHVSLFAKPETVANWRLLGLEDRSINCILAIDTSMIFAGTSKGMSLYFNSIWYDLNVELPVTSIVQLGVMLYIGAGNGSRSDAVYIGKNIINGPPFYHLEFQQVFLEPTAMAVDNTADVPRLFVGGRNAIAMGMIGKDTLYELKPIGIPEYPFGVEAPYCADLLMFSSTPDIDPMKYFLFAGGYDKFREMAGPGSLLNLDRDSLRFASLRRSNVTALAQGVWEAGPPQLVVGTQDAGVLIYNPSSQTSALLPSPGNLPVYDIITVPTLLFADMLVAACDSGVYNNTGHSGTWTEIGAIPVPPTCLALRCTPAVLQCGTFLAGTAKGVYIYDDLPVNVASHPAQKGSAGLTKWTISRNGDVRIPLENDMASPATITIYTPSGKVHKQILAARNQATFRLETGGLYFYDCTVCGTIVRRGAIMCTK